MSTLGPRISKECAAWARAFSLESSVVEDAVRGYVDVLTVGSGTSPSDGDLTKALAKLRKGLAKDAKNEARGSERAQQLDDMIARLDRSIGHTTVLEMAGLTDELPDLKGRLEAARGFVSTLRDALEHRAR